MMSCRCSVFCQEPPESSGRWECPDILGSVQVNCFVNNDQLTLATFYNSSKSNQTLQFCFGSYSDHNGGRSCSKSIKMKDVSNSIYLGRIPEDALKVQMIDKMYKFSIIYLFYSFSFLNTMLVTWWSLSWVFESLRHDTETSWSFWRGTSWSPWWWRWCWRSSRRRK